MSLALKIPDAPPAPPAYRLSDTELKLRSQFVAAFNDTARLGWDLHIAVWALTDELRAMGDLPEAVVKRIKYVAALPIAFHYRAGYKPAHLRLKDSVRQAVSISIARYFAEDH
jgi:hypothetical protein